MRSSASAPLTFWVTVIGVAWILVMTLICYIGIELSARTQQGLLAAEIITLVVFAVVALVKVYSDSPAGSIHVSADWFNPFAVQSPGAMLDGILLGVFLYWGWDSAVSVNEETVDGSNAPGKAAVLSTILLLLIYVVVTAAAQAYAGEEALVANQEDIFSGGLGHAVLGDGLDKLLDHRRSDVIGRRHADHDPARRPNGPFDGPQEGDTCLLQRDPPQAPDPGPLDLDLRHRLRGAVHRSQPHVPERAR